MGRNGLLRWEATLSYSDNSVADDGESGSVNSTTEVQVQTGINDRSDIGCRYAYLNIENTDEDYSLMCIEPKLMTVPDRVSIVVPLSLYIGENVNEDEVLHLSLGFILTHRLSVRNGGSSFHKRHHSSTVRRFGVHLLHSVIRDRSWFKKNRFSIKS